MVLDGFGWFAVLIVTYDKYFRQKQNDKNMQKLLEQKQNLHDILRVSTI